jgi:xanthine dehydrogenase accessory factor
VSGKAEEISVVEAAAAARAALEGGDAVAIVAIVAPPDRAGRRILVGPGGTRRGTLGDAALDAAAERLARAALEGAPAGAQTVSLAESECVLYVEAHHAPEQLIVVGAGHIAVPVAALGVLLGFRVVVLDDREDVRDHGSLRGWRRRPARGF